MNISRFAIHHPAVIIIIGVAVLLFGILAAYTLNQEFLPDVSLPTIVVVAQYPGVDAQRVEEEVTEILEDAFITLQGLQKIESESRNSSSRIDLEFSEAIDVYEMLPEVRAEIDRVEAQLPEDLSSTPYALVGGAGMLTMFSFSVISDRDEAALKELVEEELIPEIAGIPGTARISSYGAREKELQIVLDPERLQNLNISVVDVYQMMQASNISLPAGEVSFRSDRIFLSVEGEYSSIEELRRLIIGYAGSSFIYLSDVAEISLTYPAAEVYIESDGTPAVLVDVTKRSDGNTITIAGEIRSILEEYGQLYDGVIGFEILQDDSSMIADSLSTTIRSGLIGATMAVFIILLFLSNLRATLTIGVSIPLSIVFAFIGMRFAGQTVNILSLSGIIVALGMVVDSSIVILENIFRFEHKGYPVMEASAEGAKEVSSAVFASGTTTIAVFIPLLFLSGIIGIIMKDISLTLIFSISASLVVSLLIVPFLATHLHIAGLETGSSMISKRAQKRRERIGSGLRRLEGLYQRILLWSLDRKAGVLLTAAAVLVLSAVIVSSLGVVFIPSADTGDFYIYMKFPADYSLEESHEKVKSVNALVEDLIPEKVHDIFITGFGSEYSRSVPNRSLAYAKIILSPSAERTRSVQQIIRELQFSISSRIPDIDVVVTNGGFDKLLSLATGGGGFQIELFSSDLERLYSSADEIERVLMEDPEVYKTSRELLADQQSLITDLALDYLGELGISSYEAALTSRILFDGIEIGSYDDGGDDDYPIILTSYLADQPLGTDTFERISIPVASGESISFQNFSRSRLEDTVSLIEHKNRMRSVSVTGYTVREDTSGVRSRMISYFEEGASDPLVRWDIAGSSSLLVDSFSTLLLILGISVFLVYVVMVIQFERFIQPLIIMISIPFCFIGVVLGLLIFSSDISLIAFLGVIALGGIVVNNAIVLIDRMNSGSEKELRQRVVNGAAARLRPILMTSLTTFFGVLPMALSTGSGAEIYAPLGQAIAGGLVSSTLITLILIPVLYDIVERRRGAEDDE